jgi:hypothetical protein
VERLNALVSSYGNGHLDTAGEKVAQQVRTSSDDEMFDLIEKELGS